MWSYNQQVYPPAPFLDIAILLPTGIARREEMRAKLDTGADISAIPTDVVVRLGLQPTRTIPVEGYDGVVTHLRTYVIALEMPVARFQRLEVIAVPENYAILGRDVLNRFLTTLDGPNQAFTMEIPQEGKEEE